MTTLRSEQAVAAADSAITLQQLVVLLYRGRKTFGTVAIVIFLYSVFIAVTTPPRYTAQTSFVPPNAAAGAGSAVASQIAAFSGGLVGGGGDPRNQTVAILRSRTVLSELVNRFHLMTIYNVKKESLAEGALAGATDFSLGLGTNIIDLRVTDGNPERARDLTNAYLDALQSVSSRMALSENSQRRMFYEQKLAAEKDALATAEVALKKNQEQTGLVSPTGQTADELQAIAQLRAQVSAKEVQLAALLHDETEQNPDVVRLRRELSSLQGQVAQMENGKSGMTGDITRAQVPALMLDYVRLAREVKYHETLFDILSKQYEAARLDEAHDAQLQVLDRAIAPDSKSGPRRTMLVIAGFFLAVIAGLGAVLLSAWWRNFRWKPAPLPESLT